MAIPPGGCIWDALWHATLALALVAAAPRAGAARTLSVGPGAAFTRPSEAAAAASPGDRIEIAAGTYYDCAVLSADRVVIEGAGPETRLTDTTCQGKAILVAAARGIIVRDLTLARARVPDGNGAGIRAERADLLVQGVRFENNQDGLLAADAPAGVLQIEDCVFTQNGARGSPHPTASLVVGLWARLDIRNTIFMPGPGQSQIRSAAALTSISASRIEAATGDGATIEASGGLSMTGSTVQSGGGQSGRQAAVLSLPGPGDTLALHGNTLLGGGTLLLNWSGRVPVLAANVVGQGGVLQSTAGAWSHRLRATLGQAYRDARWLAGGLYRRLMAWLR